METFSLLKIFLNVCNINFLQFIRNIKATIAVNDCITYHIIWLIELWVELFVDR